MDPLDRFLTCVVKDLSASGYLETLENYVDFIIRKGFEILAEATIAFLKRIIRKGFSYFTSFRSNPMQTENPIFNIIYSIISDLFLPDFETILYYIKAAIDLLNKLLHKNKTSEFKKSDPFKMKEITPRAYTFTANYINTNQIADMGAAINVTKTKNTSRNKTEGTLIGTRKVNNTNFKGVEKKIIYYVGRVFSAASEQNIIDYLKDRIPGGQFECIKLKSDGNMQSFKLIANFSSKKELEDPKNWPVGVRVRPWVRKEKKSANIQNEMCGITVS